MALPSGNIFTVLTPPPAIAVTFVIYDAVPVTSVVFAAFNEKNDTDCSKELALFFILNK